MRAYVWISGLLFGAIAVVHILRVAYGWPVQVGGWTVPLDASWIAAVVTAALCAWALALARRSAP
jgi:hypothetical protein